MNDLMTKSFLNYVDLKKQAMKDLEAGQDTEATQLSRAEEDHLAHFFEEVGAIKFEMEVVAHLFQILQESNKAATSMGDPRIRKHLRETMDSDILTVLKKTRIIKEKLESLEESNTVNRKLRRYRTGGPVDRTRGIVTRGLRVKLRELMTDFQSLRDRTAAEDKEGLKEEFFGVVAGEHIACKTIQHSVSDRQFQTQLQSYNELQENHSAVKEIQKNLTELHQIFMDMSVLVDVQGEQLDDIEDNVLLAGSYVFDGTKYLATADKCRRDRNRKWVVAGCALLVVLIIFLVGQTISFLVEG